MKINKIQKNSANVKKKKETLKKKCFSRRRNGSTVWQSTTSLGRPFQSLEPAARNVRSPMVACHTLGTFSRCVRTDRSWCLLGMSATRIRSSTRYWGANLCNDLKTQHCQLKWRLAIISVMWSEQRRPATYRASALSTDWRWRHREAGIPIRVAFP